MEEKRKLVKIELVGTDPNLFANLKDKLIAMVHKVLDSSIDVNTGMTIKEEFKKFTSLGIEYAESKLKRATIENDRLLTEIEEKYSVIEKNKAESRMINATAKALEFDQSMKELSFTLKMTKALILGQSGDEAIAFTKQLDVFIEIVNNLEANKKIDSNI